MLQAALVLMGLAVIYYLALAARTARAAPRDKYLIAPYYDLTQPGPQGSPYALAECAH